MSVIINGDTGITTPAETVQGALTTTGNTILGDASTDTLNVGNGGLVKDASGNVGIGTASPARTLEIQNGTDYQLRVGNSSASTAFTYDIGRSTVNGLLYFYGNQTGNTGYVFSGVDGERMRIDSSGNLLVATTSAGGSDSNSMNFVKANGTIYTNHVTGTATTTNYAIFSYAGGLIGNIAQVGTTAVIYNTTSDYRLKENLVPLTGAKDFILSLKPKQGTWKADGSKFVGFIAHEFAEISPISVSGEKDALDVDGKPVYQSMQASSPEVMANLVSFIQEQQALITQLQADVATLKALSA